jgi:hypothetical protein
MTVAQADISVLREWINRPERVTSPHDEFLSQTSFFVLDIAIRVQNDH